MGVRNACFAQYFYLTHSNKSINNILNQKVMKKNALIFTGLCALSLCSWSVKATEPQQIHINVDMEDNHIPGEAEKIELKGKLNYNVGPDDIEAGATNNAVYLYFNHSYGNVSITLYNATGNLIYTSVVDTAVQQYVVIPILSTATGTYTVVLDNVTGFAEGDFEKRN